MIDAAVVSALVSALGAPSFIAPVLEGATSRVVRHGVNVSELEVGLADGRVVLLTVQIRKVPS